MVQLGNVGFYVGEQQFLEQGNCQHLFFSRKYQLTAARKIAEESMDVDPNYDPSDFLKLDNLQDKNDKRDIKIQDDLAVSDSEDEIDEKPVQIESQPQQLGEEEVGDLWF